MEGLDALLQYGPLGVFALYMVKKEMMWEQDKTSMQNKYEALLKEAVVKASEMKEALNDLAAEIRAGKGAA